MYQVIYMDVKAANMMEQEDELQAVLRLVQKNA